MNTYKNVFSLLFHLLNFLHIFSETIVDRNPSEEEINLLNEFQLYIANEKIENEALIYT